MIYTLFPMYFWPVAALETDVGDEVNEIEVEQVSQDHDDLMGYTRHPKSSLGEHHAPTALWSLAHHHTRTGAFFLGFWGWEVGSWGLGLEQGLLLGGENTRCLAHVLVVPQGAAARGLRVGPHRKVICPSQGHNRFSAGCRWQWSARF